MSTPRGNLGEREQSKSPEEWQRQIEADVDAAERVGDPDWVTVLTVVVGISVMELPITETVEEAAGKLNVAEPDELVSFHRHQTVGGVGYVRADSVVVIDSKMLIPDAPEEEDSFQ